MTRDAVAVVVTCYNLGRTIAESVDSVLRQTRPAAELVIVDDGSDDAYTLQVLAALERAGTRVVRTPNRGVCAARNTAVRSTSAPLVVILDGDDLLAPTYLETLGARLDANPDLDYVSCAQKGFGASSYVWRPPDPSIPESIVRGVVHASSMMRRAVWESVGGFDETIPRNEVLDFWTTVLEHGFRGSVVDEPLLLYRVRPDSQYHTTITPAATAECMQAFYRKHWHTIASHAEDVFAGKEAFLIEQHEHQAHVVNQIAEAERELEALRAEAAAMRAELERLGRPAVDMGELRRTAPFSEKWGVERGLPVDRHYIEVFLGRHRADIRGRVLEIKDAGYTRLFGGERVTQSDVLDIDAGNERANIHADLASAGVIPGDTYDAFILTQTLGLIFDAGAAIREAFRILKPGGVLLCTAPAAGRISHEDRGADGDFWRFTEASLRRLFSGAFPLESFEIAGFGNVLADAAFLYGLAAEELTEAEFRIADQALPLVYGIRAVKPAASADGERTASSMTGAATTVGAFEGENSAVPVAPGEQHSGWHIAAAQAGEGALVAGAEQHRSSRAAGPAKAGGAVILAYHRISERDESGPWVLPARRFAEQMAWLRDRFEVLSLDEATAAIRDRRLPERAVIVTLDDGYLECLTVAAHILAERRIPATVFVTGGGEDAGSEFYWDLLERVFAGETRLPPELHLPDHGLGHLATATPDDRTELRRRLNERFYGLPGAEREALAAHLKAWAGLGSRHPDRRPLSAGEVQQLAAMPGITIGAHGRHHLAMPLHPEGVQRDEAASNKHWLESLAGRQVEAFAYPYGERNETTVRAVREAGFTIGVTVDGVPAESGWPALLLPRCEVSGVGGVDFDAWLEALFAGKEPSS